MNEGVSLESAGLGGECDEDASDIACVLFVEGCGLPKWDRNRDGQAGGSMMKREFDSAYAQASIQKHRREASTSQEKKKKRKTQSVYVPNAQKSRKYTDINPGMMSPLKPAKSQCSKLSMNVHIRADPGAFKVGPGRTSRCAVHGLALSNQ